MALGVRTRVKAPTNFTATAVSDTAINLAWTGVSSAFRMGAYTLERSSDGGANYSNLYTGSNVTYVDTGLAATTSYLYRLTFTDANNHASPSLSAGATTQASPNSGAQQKFIAGWYMGLSLSQTGTGRPSFPYVGVPNAGTPGVPNSGVRSVTGPISNKVAGVQIRHTMRELNPTAGTYDLSRIANELAQLATFPIDATNPNPLLLFVRIEVRTFAGVAPADNPMPLDLVSVANGGTGTKDYFETYNSNAGFQGWRWSPTVQARFDAICQKIGQAFDQHPNFGGCGTQETSIGGLSTNGGSATVYSVTSPGGTTYTASDAYDPNNFVRALKDESNSFKRWMPHCRGYHYMNFIAGAVQNNPPAGQLTEDGYLEDYCATIVRNGGICGFPDLVPNGAPFTRTYPTINKVHNGTLPGVQDLPANQRRGVTMGGIQPAEWSNSPPASTAMTLQQRFDLATARAGTQYGTGSPLNLDNICIDWQVNVNPPGTQKWNPDGAAIVLANPSFGNYAPPSPNPTYLYVDVNAVTNGSGASAAVPTNVVPGTLNSDNVIILFNADNGIQYMPTRQDTIVLNANQIQIGSYGTGKATIAALDTFTSGWTLVSGTVYKRTYAPASGFVGAVLNMSDTTGSAQGTVLKWTDMTAFASFVPSSLAVGSYAYDWSGTIMYVNVGANANTKTFGIARNGRFVNVSSGAAPTTIEISNLRMVGFSRTAITASKAPSAWKIHDCETYAIGGYFATSTTSPPGSYEGTAILVSGSAANIEITNNLIEETFTNSIGLSHSGAVSSEALSNVHIHHNTIRKWSLAAFSITDFASGSGNTFAGVEINHNIATGGGSGFAGLGDGPFNVCDGVQVRGANTSVTGLNVHDNTIQSFDAAFGGRTGSAPGTTLANNRFSSARYGIRNQVAGVVITATQNQFCASAIGDVSDVNGTPTTTSLNGGAYTLNTTQAGQCYTPDLSTQGVQ
jgi:hypothetical protein